MLTGLQLAAGLAEQEQIVVHFVKGVASELLASTDSGQQDLQG